MTQNDLLKEIANILNTPVMVPSRSRLDYLKRIGVFPKPDIPKRDWYTSRTPHEVIASLILHVLHDR